MNPDPGKTVTYRVHVHDEGAHGLWAEIEELPGAFAAGANMDELQESLAEAVAMYLSGEGFAVRVIGLERERVSEETVEEHKFLVCT